MATRAARQRRSAATPLADETGRDGADDAPGAAGDGDDGAGAAAAGISLRGDRRNLALLLLLYTLQGVPMGLANSVTFVMQERGVSLASQGAPPPFASCAVLARAAGRR